jgi:hypothetical protein
MAFQKQLVDVNTANSTISVPHWGITLRTLFGAALAAWPEAQPGERRAFTVLMKDKEIATIHVQKHLTPTTSKE